MRTRRSPRNQERLYRQIGADLRRAAFRMIDSDYEESGRWDLDAPSVIPEADFREWPCPLGGACTDPTCHTIKNRFDLERQEGEDIGSFALRVGLLDAPGGSHA